MKTRIVKTKFWSDNTVQQLSANSRYLYIYLITNPRVGMTNYFELPLAYIKVETGMTDGMIQNSLHELAKLGKAFYGDGWVCVPKLERHNKYKNSPSNEGTYEDELNTVPSDVRAKLDSSVDTSVCGTVDSNQKPKTINNKPKIINQKPKIVDEAYLQELTEKFSDVNVQLEWEKARDWMAASGKKKKDMRAFFRNWLRRAQEDQTSKKGGVVKLE